MRHASPHQKTLSVLLVIGFFLSSLLCADAQAAEDAAGQDGQPEAQARQARGEARATSPTSAPPASRLRSLIRPDHPRLFLNADMWPAMRARALEEGKATYEKMKETADGLPPLEEITVKDWAPELAPSAFVYLMTGDEVLLAKIRRMLRASVDVYNAKEPTHANYGCAPRGHRMSWLAAMDWVWNGLDPDERLALASDMIENVHRHLDKFPGTNGWGGSFYTPDKLYWYAGVALLDDDLDQESYDLALELLEEGYNDHQKMFASRGQCRQDDGALSPRLEYTLPAWPDADWKFLHSWRAAVGPGIPREWHHSAFMPNHAFWNLLPGPQHFGLGSAWHTRASVPFEVLLRPFSGYLAQHIFFFEDLYPDLTNLSRYLWQRMDFERYKGKYGYVPIWSEIWSPVDEHGAPLPENLPLARHFAGNGTVLMRSGSGPADTYALFNPGGGVDCSPQFDATHFAIYKQGFLALDAGTRNDLPHQTEYFSQSVAHNCVLIRMPGETFEGMFGREAQSNSGGQYRKPEFAEMLAFESAPLFAYAASDATGTYRPEKCVQMIRQFLYVAPDHFVIFDRVVSTKAEYPKKWLLHTSNEPTVTDRTFRADQDEGRVFCRVHYPSDAQLVKIGGPGREFWADGKNWPLSDNWWDRFPRHLPAEQRENQIVPETMGRWRVEVHPGAAREQDYFLHLIQAADQSVEEMVDSEMREVEDRIELTFTVGERTYTIALNKTGEVGGHIHIEEDGEMLVDRPLTQEIMPQAGLALSE